MSEQDKNSTPEEVDHGAEDSGNEKDDFDLQLEKTLRETEQAVLDIEQIASDPDQSRSWNRASDIVKSFKPVPDFIWRLVNFAFGKPGAVAPLSEGHVFGLRRLLFAAASDPVLGVDERVQNVRKALRVLDPDVVAAVSLIHAVCRRLKSMPHERIWTPILEDAVLRARIGYDIGAMCPDFGPGRGMLAGFSGRAGLTILIASGELEEARKALEMLATGTSIRDVGIAIYKCDPLQVSVMVLSAAGCGRDASFGAVSYASEHPLDRVSDRPQLLWLSAYALCEAVRVGSDEHLEEAYCEALGISSDAREELFKGTKKFIRRGHGWHWLIG